MPSYFLPLQLCTFTTPGRPRRVKEIRCGCTNYVSGVLQEVIWYSNVPWLNCYQYIPFIYVREVVRSRSGERRSSNFVVRWPEVTMKGKGYGLRMCRICHLSILIYYLTTIRLHNILLFFLLIFYGASAHFQAMASPIFCLHHASSLLPRYTCTGMYQRHRKFFSKFYSSTHPASYSMGTRVPSAEVK